jgi:hypothetical protein
MSNHFPAVPDPGTWDLAGVTYLATVFNSGAGLPIGNTGDFDLTGVDVRSNSSLFGPNLQPLNFVFLFTTPGDPGGFDQDSVESALTSMLDNIAQALATATGDSLGTAKGLISVTRTWTFQAEGWQAIYYADTLTYPAA